MYNYLIIISIIILKQITIPLIAQSLIHKQTITNEKVMTKRIIETAKDIIINLTDLNINLDDMDIIDEDDKFPHHQLTQNKTIRTLITDS